jgi:hypothetical protein
MDNDFDYEAFEYGHDEDEKAVVEQIYSDNNFEVDSFDGNIYFLNFDL